MKDYLEKHKKKHVIFFLRKKMLMRTLLFLLICSTSILINAQTTKNIRGIVSEKNGEPVIGASVSISGTNLGTSTDVDGKFSLSLPANLSANATVAVSYIGFVGQKKTIGNETNFQFVLEEDLTNLGEIVVVGYGAQKKTTLTGSVAQVNSEQLLTTKNTNVQNMMTGKLPGLRVIEKTSEPGNFSNQFDIRGLGSPLLVVDGVPRGDLARMDPNDIESVSILKDASTSVYGFNGSNGVVLVTTKSGTKGKTKIEYSMYYGIQTPAEILQPIGAYDRALLYNETTMRNTTAPVKTYDDAYFEALRKGEMPDTDWYAEVMRKTAPQQQHNVSISGGSEKIDYYVNLGYNDQGSFFRTNSANYHRYNLRTNLNVNITKDLKGGVKLNLISDETERQNVATTGIFNIMWRSRPTDPLYANDTAPYYYHPDNEYNPVAAIHPELSGFVNNKKNIFQSNMYLQYDAPFLKGLSAKFMYSYDKTFDDNSDFKKEYNEYRYVASNDTYQTYLRNGKTSLRRTYNTSYTTLMNFSLNYNRTFLDTHNVGAMLLYEERYNQGYNFNAFRYFDIPIPYLQAGNTEGMEGNGSGLNETANAGIVGRLNYDYLGKYMAEFAFRYDGSSTFPKGHKWALFPSVLLAYRLSEESFIKDNVSFVNNLKLKASWGRTANEGGVSSGQFYEGYDYPASGNRNSIARGYVFGSTFVNGLGFRNAPYMYLTWESHEMKNLGLEADLWNGLAGFSLDFFQRDRENIATAPSVIFPATLGTGISQINFNAERAKGFEVELRHTNRVNKDFLYKVTGFVSMTRTLRTKILQPDRSNSYDYWRNNVLNRYNDIWFGYGSAGQYQSYEDIANSIYSNTGTLPGDPIYEDWNGDGVIDDRDKHPIATTTNPNEGFTGKRNYPLMNLGLNLAAQWKSFDFSALFQGSAMSYISYGEQLLEPLAWDGNALELLFDRWHPVDPDKDPYNPSNQWVSGYYPYGKTRADIDSKFNIQNGTYLRLKTVELGFAVPKNILFSKSGIKDMRLFINAYNLVTFTKVRGVDPEKPTESSGYMYPLNRTINFGGSLSF